MVSLDSRQQQQLQQPPESEQQLQQQQPNTSSYFNAMEAKSIQSKQSKTKTNKNSQTKSVQKSSAGTVVKNSVENVVPNIFSMVLIPASRENVIDDSDSCFNPDLTNENVSSSLYCNEVIAETPHSIVNYRPVRVFQESEVELQVEEKENSASIEYEKQRKLNTRNFDYLRTLNQPKQTSKEKSRPKRTLRKKSGLKPIIKSSKTTGKIKQKTVFSVRSNDYKNWTLSSGCERVIKPTPKLKRGNRKRSKSFVNKRTKIDVGEEHFHLSFSQPITILEMTPFKRPRGRPKKSADFSE